MHKSLIVCDRCGTQQQTTGTPYPEGWVLVGLSEWVKTTGPVTKSHKDLDLCAACARPVSAAALSETSGEATAAEQRARNAALEEAAQVSDAEELTGVPPIDWPLDKIEACEATLRATKKSIAAAIRALKSPEPKASE